jgi:hypothetical protein
MKPLFQVYLVENEMPSIVGGDLHKKITRKFQDLMRSSSPASKIKVIFEVKSPTLVRGELMYVDQDYNFHCTMTSDSIEIVSKHLALDMLSKLDCWHIQSKIKCA